MWKNFVAFIIFHNRSITITIKKEIPLIFNKKLYVSKFYITDIYIYIYIYICVCVCVCVCGYIRGVFKKRPNFLSSAPTSIESVLRLPSAPSVRF